MRLFVSCIPFDGGKSGISVYIRNIVRELSAAGHTLTLAVEPGAERFFPGFETVSAPGWTRRPVLSMLWHLFLLPGRIDPAKFDRVLILAANRRMTARTRGVPVTAVVHDLSQYHIPVKYDPFRMFYIRRILPYFVRRADKIVAISRSTREDLIRFWRVPENRISVRWNGVNAENLPSGRNDGVGKQIVYLSRIESPGKNHLGLIEAWEKLPDFFTGEYTLVFAGADWNGAEAVHARAEASPKRKSIVFAGFLPKEQLDSLRLHARMFICPSLFEGFGLPVAESMVCGAVTACADNSSLRELAEGGAALLFPAEDSAVMADVIFRGCTDENLRRSVIEKGLLRGREFRWSDSAAELVSELPRTGRVLGVSFSTGTMAEALKEIEETVRSDRRTPVQNCFINADCLNQAYGNPEYRSLLAEAGTVWPDGVGVAIASKWLSCPVRENVNGTDMLPLLCRRGFRLYLLGAGRGIAEKAKLNLEKQYPGCRICGARDGFFRPEETSSVISGINESGAEILLVAMGVPRQEFWIRDHLSELKCKMCIGVGGLFDFASGRIPRAPLFLRKLKLEWAFRLYQEPVRLFRRYVIGNPLFLWRVFRHGAER